MTAFLYEKAFLICAGLDYCDPDPDLVLAGDSRNTCSDNTASTESSGRRLCDMNRHLTNLSINKAMAGHPGLVPCLMTTECPSVSHSPIHFLFHSRSHSLSHPFKFVACDFVWLFVFVRDDAGGGWGCMMLLSMC